MTNIPADVLTLAQSIAHHLSVITGVRAVALGGSWARGEGDLHSDLDLGIYYDSTYPPRLRELRELAAQLDDRHQTDVLTDFGGWGPWINGGGWLVVGGRRVDWIYRDLKRVRQVMDECLKGRPTSHYQPGHPHAFHTPIYVGEIALGIPLHDAHGDLAALKSRALPYPSVLRRALVEGNLWEAGFALETTRKAAVRGDMLHVSGSLFRCASCLVQALFALNEQYCLNEKGALATTAGFAHTPIEFHARVQRTLSHIGIGSAGLQVSVSVFESLVAETRALCVEAALI